MACGIKESFKEYQGNSFPTCQNSVSIIKQDLIQIYIMGQ